MLPIYTFTAKDGSEVLLRPVEERDAVEIIEAVKGIVDAGEFIQKEKPRTLEEERKFIRQMREMNNMYTAIENGGKVIGIARIVRGDLEMKKHTGVFRTWISKEGQGKGIGKEVMKYSLKWGKEAGLHKVWLTVFAQNEKAVNVYKKSGFFVEGCQKEQAKINGKFQDEWFMAYFLNQEER